MKTLIPLLAYALLSGLLGLVVCSWLLWKSKRPRAAAMAALIFFGGSPTLYGYLYLKESSAQTSFEEDVAYVKELCAKSGGDKIYKTVDDVEGVFQMRARNPDPEDQYRDQFGMEDPWGSAQDDGDDPGIPVGYSNKSYRYLEMQPEYGKQGPPFRRKVGVDTGRKVSDRTPNAVPERRNDPIWEHQIFLVTKLRSRYGYITEDLSTPEMRKRWIAGGRIKIIDLQTNEVLAERVGYFRAIGTHAKLSWSGASAYQNQRICPHNSTLGVFLLSVLKPAPAITPTQQAAQSFIKE